MTLDPRIRALRDCGVIRCRSLAAFDRFKGLVRDGLATNSEPSANKPYSDFRLTDAGRRAAGM